MKTKDALHIEAKLPISESVRKRNPHLYPNPEEHSGMTTLTVQVPVPPKPKRIRQSSKPLMNKLESEYFEVLKRRFNPVANVYSQSMRLMLGNGTWYKVDFMRFVLGGGMEAWEVKGPHAFRGGFEALKIAAHKYPEITFFLVWKENGVWQEQEVLP